MSDPVDFAALISGAGSRPRTASEYVEQTLRQAILSGALPGGTPLRQEALAEAFAVSRMPVREALRQLEAQALLDFVPHKGAVVTEISAEDAADIYAIRRALEPAVLERSIPNLTVQDLDRAEVLLTEMDTDEETGALGDLNRRFHMTLYGAAGRPKMIALTESYLKSFDRYLRFQISARGRTELSQDSHLEILDAARSKDIPRALDALRQHLDEAALRIAAFFRDRP